MRNTIFLKLMLGLLVAATVLIVTACGDNQDDDPEVAASWTTSYVIEASFSEDFLKVADITANFAHPDGTYSSEQVAKTSNKWILKNNRIPDKGAVMFAIDPKQNVTEGLYEIEASGTLMVSSFKNGKEEASNYANFSSKMSVSSEKLDAFLKNKCIVFGLGVDGEGGIVKVNTADFDFGENGGREIMDSTSVLIFR